MAAYGSGRTTALVIDFGEHKTDVIPVQGAASHSVVINEAVSRLNVGGAQLTDFMMQMLPLSGFVKLRMPLNEIDINSSQNKKEKLFEK